MIDVKKLITGFLVLAVAATCSGIILSLINLAPGGAPVAAQQITIEGGSAATANANAFLPTEAQVQQVAAALAPELASSTMFVSSTNPNNLTDVMATEFVNGIVAANPSGPTGTDGSGNPTFNPPNAIAMATYVANAPAAKNLQIPNWDVEAASIPVTVIGSGSTTLTNYGDAVNSILNAHLDAQVQSIANSQTGSASVSDLTYAESQVKETLQDVASLKTPAPAVAYQKSLLANLVYEKNMLQLSTLAQTDPVKASMIFEQEDQKFTAVQQDFENQAQELTSNYLSFEQPQRKLSAGGMALSFIDHTFGIPEAHALWPVFDPATWALISSNEETTIQTQLTAVLKNTLLQILKNTLITLVQQKVLAWVAGSGAPRFITDWGATLVNAAQTNAINFINNKITSGCVYSAFAPQVMVTLKAFYSPTDNSACADLFQAALGANSFQQFYSDFSNGGFLAFGASTLPSGNPYGTTFFTAQESDLAYHNQQAVTTLQTQTSQGFKGDAVCDDNSNPNGNSTFCEDSSGAYGLPDANNKCPTGDKTVTNSNGGLCADGTQPVVQTPAAITAFSIDNSNGSTYQQLAAANDIVGLLNSVMSSLIMGLANATVNAAGQLVNNTLSGLGASGLATYASSTPLATYPLECNPSTQTIPSASAGAPTSTGSTATSTAPASLSATGGTYDSAGNFPTYYWSATNGVTSTGSMFSDTFATPGTYTVFLTDSAGDATTTCTVIQQ